MGKTVKCSRRIYSRIPGWATLMRKADARDESLAGSVFESDKGVKRPRASSALRKRPPFFFYAISKTPFFPVMFRAVLKQGRPAAAAAAPWRGRLPCLGFRVLSGGADPPLSSESESEPGKYPWMPRFDRFKRQIRRFFQYPLEPCCEPYSKVIVDDRHFKRRPIISKDANGHFRRIDLVEGGYYAVRLMRDGDTPICLGKPSLLLDVFCFELCEDITLMIHWSDTIGNLKIKIRDETNIPLEEQFLYSADGIIMENDEKLVIEYGILNHLTTFLCAIRIYLSLQQRGMIPSGSFCMALTCEAGVFLCCDTRSSYVVKRKDDKRITYLPADDNNEKMMVVNENIGLVMAGDTRKYPLIRAIVAKVCRHLPKEFTLEDITSAMHAEISPDPDTFVGVSVIFADRRMHSFNLVTWKARSTIFVPDRQDRCAAVGSGASFVRPILDRSRRLPLSYEGTRDLCCRAGYRAFALDKACGGRFRVFFANMNQPWSEQPNDEFSMMELTSTYRSERPNDKFSPMSPMNDCSMKEKEAYLACPSISNLIDEEQNGILNDHLFCGLTSCVSCESILAYNRTRFLG